VVKKANWDTTGNRDENRCKIGWFFGVNIFRVNIGVKKGIKFETQAAPCRLPPI